LSADLGPERPAPTAERLERTRERIRTAALRAGRDPETVRLLAVSKTFPLARILEAAAAEQRAFGESRVQEAEAKVEGAERAGASLEWHLIGRLQRNKARRACALFDVIHSVDRVELAEALARHATPRARPLGVFVQVDIDGEPQKGGVAPDQTVHLVERILALPALELRGLMAIPRYEPDPERTRPSFARLRLLAEDLRLKAPVGGLCELSMGMSHDFEVAIEEGATWVRVGSAIFGEREAP